MQFAKLLSHPKQAKIICASLSEKIKNNFDNIDIILSPALGGIVVGYEVGRQLDVKTIFAERIDGNLTLRRGFNIFHNSNVLIVEDVITTGKSVSECSKIVKKNNANLIGYACIIDRSDNERVIKDKIVSQIKLKIAIFKGNEVPEDLKKIPAKRPGSRNFSK